MGTLTIGRLANAAVGIATLRFIRLAKGLGFSLPILYALIKAGKLRSYHIVRAYRVSEQSIADCIALPESENQDRPASSPRRRRTQPPEIGSKSFKRERSGSVIA